MPNIPRAISEAAVRMNCLKALDFTTWVTTPSSSFVRRREGEPEPLAASLAAFSSARACSSAAWSAAAFWAPASS